MKIFDRIMDVDAVSSGTVELFPQSLREMDCLIASMKGWKSIECPDNPKEIENYVGFSPMAEKRTIFYYSSSWADAGILLEEICRDKGSVSVWMLRDPIEGAQISRDGYKDISEGTRVSFVEGEVGSFGKSACEAIAKAWLAYHGVKFSEAEVE